MEEPGRRAHLQDQVAIQMKHAAKGTFRFWPWQLFHVCRTHCSSSDVTDPSHHNLERAHRRFLSYARCGELDTSMHLRPFQYHFLSTRSLHSEVTPPSRRDDVRRKVLKLFKTLRPRCWSVPD